MATDSEGRKQFPIIRKLSAREDIKKVKPGIQESG
jgi:hypothetical protein